MAAIPLAILALPLLLVALLKSRRRKSRFSAGDPAQRVGGGWSEVVSLATDMGAAVDTRATRRESAAVLAEAFPGSQSATTMLARRADASIFGAGQPSEDEVREYWTIVDGSLKEMTSTVGFWRRQQARFSPRSLLSDARNALKARNGAGRGDGGRFRLPVLPFGKAADRRRTPAGPETGGSATPPAGPGAPTPEAPPTQGPKPQ